jgi:hypothetical protein
MSIKKELKGQKNPVNICWLGEKYKGNFVCFIPFTIDGVGRNARESLENLEAEVVKIARALRQSKIKCNFSVKMVRAAIYESAWYKHHPTTNGKGYEGAEEAKRKLGDQRAGTRNWG